MEVTVISLERKRVYVFRDRADANVALNEYVGTVHRNWALRIESSGHIYVHSASGKTVHFLGRIETVELLHGQHSIGV